MGRFQRRATLNFILFLVGYSALLGLLFLAIQYRIDNKVDDTIALVLMGLLFPVIDVMGIVGFRRARLYDAAYLPDVKPSLQQPDLAFALQSGETLSLIKKGTRQGMFVVWTSALSTVVIALNVFPLIRGHPIVTILYTCGILPTLIGSFIGIAQARHQTISADDYGVMVKYSLLPRRRLAWHDIQTVICTSYPALGIMRKNYLLVGKRRNLSLELNADVQRSTESHSSALAVVEGDGETYADNINRLLATLVVRTHSTIRNLHVETKTAKRYPFLSLISSEVNALPLAPAYLQLQRSSLAVSDIAGATITLHPKPPYFRLYLIILTVALSFITFSFLLEILLNLWLAPSGHITYWFQHEVIYQLIAAIISLGLFIPVGQLIAMIFYRQRRPILIATPEGLALGRLRARDRNATLHIIPWDKIQAWAVMVMPDKHLFVVYGDGAIYPWYEKPTYRQGGRVQGDRRDAYHRQAEQLHAMIALKTGLQLHEIPM